MLQKHTTTAPPSSQSHPARRKFLKKEKIEKNGEKI
jgi:hypothetical protein